MKKTLSFLMVAVMLVLSFSMAVSADNFVPSITYKPAPDLVYTEGEDGKKIIGYVVDPEGNKLTTEYHDCLLITSVAEAPTSEKIPDDARDTLLAVYDELSAADMKLSTISDELNALTKAAIGHDADHLVVKDLFDVTVLCDELKTNLAPVGNTIDLTFELPVNADSFVVVMTYKNGEWAPIEKTVNNDDGTITCTFEDFCPVAILVPATDEGLTPPATGDIVTNQVAFWGFVMVISTALIVVLVVVSRRNSKKVEAK